ncbi:alpha/beta fold hydrolase [Streptomyces zhihengii]
MHAQGQLIAVGDIELWTEEFGDPAPGGPARDGLDDPGPAVARRVRGPSRGRRTPGRPLRPPGRGPLHGPRLRDPPYTWAALKDDALGLMDALGIDRAHVVGHSAGGLIAQWIAAEHPERLESLTVIGSSPLGEREGQVLMRALLGEPQPAGSLPEPRPEFIDFFRAAITAAPPRDRAEAVDLQIATARIMNGTALPFDEDAQRRLEETLFDRSRDPRTTANHRLAGMADPEVEPTGLLGTVRTPTLVVEGTHEPAKPGHGRLIADAVPGARLLMVPSMGHMIAPEVVAPVATALLQHFAAATAAAADGAAT